SHIILSPQFVFTLLAIISAIGIINNSLLLLTTLRSKFLRAPCNKLIAIGAVFDILHQIGLTPHGFVVYGGQMIKSSTCNMIMFIPELGCSAGSFAVLSIGIDRFISISASGNYRKLNTFQYLSVSFFAI
ncbi:hypothetical protein PFISCL1PPCAC_14155, partial [Pristionchus fissidentatus]